MVYSLYTKRRTSSPLVIFVVRSSIKDMEMVPEQLISAKEGGLEVGIEKAREMIRGLAGIFDQIERLQRVPAGYHNLAGEGKVDTRELPALDQGREKRMQYDEQFAVAYGKLEEAHTEVLALLSILREVTGISTK